MATRDRARRGAWGGLFLCALALTACGESATPLSTATASPARVVSTIGPAPTATVVSLPVPTPEAAAPATEAASPVTTTIGPATGPTSPATPATPAPNAPMTGIATARTAPGPTAQTAGATPTPLAFGIATAARATVAANTVAASTARATAAPSTPITGSTSGSAVAGAGTGASGTVVALATRPALTGTASGGTTGTTAATAASTTTRAANTVAAMATEMAPTVRAQSTVVNFLNVVLRNGDLSTFLAPGLRGQDGAQVLGITGTIRMFEVTGERPDPDGTGMIVSATITTASGTVTKQIHMSRSGNGWVIDRVG